MKDTLTVPAELAQLERVRAFVVDRMAAAGVGDTDRIDVMLAVSEAVANVVRHTFAGREGTVAVTITVGDGCVSLVVVDDGPPWDGTRSAPSADGAGGYGVALIEDVMDTVVHRPLDPAGNRLVLEKRVRS